MSASDRLEAVDVVKLSCNFVTEKPPGTTGTDRPSFDIFGVTPDEIAKGALVRDLLCSSNYTDLVDRANLGRKTTVNTEDSAINNGRENEKIKDLAARFPDRGVAVLLLALFVEPIDLRDLAGFMVSTNKNDSVRISS